MTQERAIVRKLLVSINRIDGLWYMLARKSKIKENTLSLLLALDDGIPRTQKQICEEWIIPKTTINTIVKECISAGYAELSSCEKTKEKLLCLTPKGKQYAEDALALFYKAENEAMRRTLTNHPAEFIDAIESYANFLKEETNKVAASER